MTFEEIDLPKNTIKRSRNKNKTINNTRTTKSTIESFNKLIKRNSYNIGSLSTKIFPSPVKEVNPLPIKLGEIKEIDSVVNDSTGRNKNQDDTKNIKNKNEEGNNLIKKESNSSINNSKNKNININKRKSSFLKNSLLDNNQIKENQAEQINNSDNSNKSKNNKNNNININHFKKEIKTKFSTRNTPKLSSKNLSSKNLSSKNLSSKEIKKQSSKSKSKSNKINQIIEKNSQSYIDSEKQEKKSENLWKSQEKSDYISNNDNDNLLLDNNSLLNDSGSFGNYQASNLLENLSEQFKEKDYITNNISKKNKNAKNEENEKNNEKLVSNSKDKNKKIKFKFNAYNENNDAENKDSLSFEQLSSLNKGDNALIKKIKMIESKEERIKINKNINSIDKNKIDDNLKENNSNLYMLNFREGTANGEKPPFTLMDTKGIFFEFFKKKK